MSKHKLKIKFKVVNSKVYMVCTHKKLFDNLKK